MTITRFGSRIKAAVLSAVMTATVFVSPMTYQFTQVTAAGTTTTVNYTLTAVPANDEDEAPNKVRIAVPKDATTITLGFETAYEGNMSFGVYGLELGSAPWWADVDTSLSAKAASGKGTLTYNIPAAYKGIVNKICLGLWYPEGGATVKITSLSTDGSAADPSNPSGPSGPQKVPTSENAKSGAYSFKDNGDGTATITTTLTAEIQNPDMDYLLTAGHDEEEYYKTPGDANSVEIPEGAPINSHKFTLGEFGLDDMANINIQSFNYTITCEKEMDQFQYGGGINVAQFSAADTECLKEGKEGYWYNDQGDDDVEKYGEIFKEAGVKYHGGYKVENAGSYIEVVWDVPEYVQEYVSKNDSDTVSFQFWYADTTEDGEYAPVEEVHLTSASCTYTREMTVPYNKPVNKKIGEKYAMPNESMPTVINFEELELGKRSVVSAIKFNFSSTVKDISKLQFGFGISIADTLPSMEGWYQPANNITVLKPEKFEVMYILPKSVRENIYYDGGTLDLGVWYAGEDQPTITLESADIYEFISKEPEDITVSPEKFEISVGEEKQIEVNIPGCTFEVAKGGEEYVEVMQGGLVLGVSEGKAIITVRSPEGQEKTVTVIVTDDTTEPPTSSTSASTSATSASSKTTATTAKEFDDRTDINWDKVKYGDVNIDEYVTVADIVLLNKYLLNSKSYSLTATQKENADCVYDHSVETSDSTVIMNYVGNMTKYENLGPQKGDKIHTSWPLEDDE